MYLVGNNWANCLKTHNKLTMCLPGKTPSAPSVISDVFDGAHYRKLLEEKVSVDGQAFNHTYFQDACDIALGFGTDGFAPFHRRKLTAWPLLLFNYNLPPTD